MKVRVCIEFYFSYFADFFNITLSKKRITNTMWYFLL